MKKLLGILTSVAAVLVSSQALAASLAPSSMAVGVGSYEGKVSALAKADSSAVKLYSNGKGNLQVTFQFSAVSLSGKLTLASVFRQKRAADVYTFSVKNPDGSFSAIGSTTGGTAYKNLSFNIPASALINKSVTVRMVASAGSDDCLMDALLLSDSGVAPTPTPAPSATPTPTPKPTMTPLPTPVVSPTPRDPASTVSIPAGTKWYWQLQGTVNQSVAAKIYDIDLYDNSQALFASLKAQGHIVICYFSAGTYEPNRPDSSKFPAASLGKGVQGWPGEKWLDVRDATVRQIMQARLDLAKSKGCDGVEPDNVDGYANGNGFNLTQADQVSFNTFLADQSHARGLIVGLKNSTDLVSKLVNKFDFAVVEECFKYKECEEYSPFIDQGKAVLNAEYTSYSASTCTQAARLNFSTVFFNLDLNGKKYDPCQ